MKKKIFLFLVTTVIFLAIFLFSGIAEAGPVAPRPLEVSYPEIPHIPPLTKTVSLPVYVKYLYYLIITLSGILAFGVLVYAGFTYFTSVGNPVKMQESIDRIRSCIIGLLLLFGSWLILRTINPQLTVLRSPDELPPIIPDINRGIYFCKEQVAIPKFWEDKITAEGETPEKQKQIVAEMLSIKKTIEENCYQLSTRGNVKKEFEGKIKFIYLVPDYFEERQYGVIIYEERDFQGKGTVIFGDGKKPILENPVEWSLEKEKVFSPASAKPFSLNLHPLSSWYVELYQFTDFNRDVKLSSQSQQPAQKKYTVASLDLSTNISTPVHNIGLGTFFEIGSLKIEGDLIVVFFKDPGPWYLTSDIDIYTESDSNLNDNPMGRWNPRCVEKRRPVLEDRYFPCADHMVVISASVF